MGVGFTSRVGFWLWYVVPIACLLFADLWLGAVLFATYAAVRTGCAWLLAAIVKQRPSLDLSVWLMRHIPHARRISGAYLLLISFSTVAIVGF